MGGAYRHASHTSEHPAGVCDSGLGGAALLFRARRRSGRRRCLSFDVASLKDLCGRGTISRSYSKCKLVM